MSGTDLTRAKAPRKDSLESRQPGEQPEVATSPSTGPEPFWESESRLWSLCDSLPVMIGVVEIAGDDIILISGNHQTALFLGCTPEELPNRRASSEAFPESLRRAWVRRFRSAHRIGRRVRFETDFPLEGGHRWLSVTLAPLDSHTGPNPRFGYLVEDITEQRTGSEAERRLAEEQATRLEAEAARAEAERARTEAEQARAEAETAREEADRARRTVVRTFEQMTDAFLSLDAEWRFTFLNPQAEKMLRYVSTDLLGQCVWDLFPEADISRIEDEFRTAMARQTPAAFETFFAPFNVWLEVRAYPSPDELSVFFRNVTGRKQTEAALLASEARFRHLADVVPEIVWSTTPDGRADYMNQRWCDYTGQSLEEAVGHGWTAAIHPEDRETCMLRWKQSVEGNVPFDTEYRVRGADGAYRWFLGRAVPVYGPEPGEMRWYGTCTDIDDQKRAEAALHEVSQRLKYHVENSPLAVIEFDADFRITRWSQDAERMFGWSAEEVLGVEMFSLPWVHPDDLPDVKGVRQYMADGGQRIVSPNRNVRKDGSFIWCEWYNSALLDENGRLDSILSLILDVTERQRLESELRERAEALAAADRAKDEFLAMLAHELRNPLGAISNAIALMDLHEGDRQAERRARQVLARQVAHTTKLVDDLLDVSRITRGKITLNRDTVSLTESIESVLRSIRPVLEAKKLRVDFTAEEDLAVFGDPVRLHQVLVNLLENAVKYTDKGGVHVTLWRDGDEAAISIRDTGIGIAPEMHDRIFELFTQADLSLARSQGGLGIGLTLARQIITMHGGSVEVQSDGEGRGSTFTVRLPVVEPAAMTTEAAPATAIRTIAQRVLVVDDNKDAGDTLAAIIDIWGHDVRVAHDGYAALRAAAEFRPRFVLLDIGLPGLDGYEVARRMLEIPAVAGACLIAVTGYGQEEDRHRTRDAGFHHHIVKPVDLDALRKLLGS